MPVKSHKRGHGDAHPCDFGKAAQLWQVNHESRADNLAACFPQQLNPRLGGPACCDFGADRVGNGLA